MTISDALLRNLVDKDCPTCEGTGDALVDYFENYGAYYELCECCWGRMVIVVEYFPRTEWDRIVDINDDEFGKYLAGVL